MKYLLAFLLVLTLAPAALGVGCCCSDIGAAETGGVQDSADFCSEGYEYVPVGGEALLGDPETLCLDICEAYSGAVCGNGVVEIGEECDDGNTVPDDGCSAECKLELPLCERPGFDEPPRVTLEPVKGEKAIHMNWTYKCPASSIVVRRCAEGLCDTYTLPAAQREFTDTGVLWSTQYTYEIQIVYEKTGPSANRVVDANPGDIECAGKYDEFEFCVSLRTYEDQQAYLEANGYDGVAATEFSEHFETTVEEVFGHDGRGDLNQVRMCNEQNQLQETDKPVCAEDQACLNQDGNFYCKDMVCRASSKVMGTVPDRAACEQEYCFFDRSKTVVDACYACSPTMTCGDYKSQEACTANACGAGYCEWKPTMPEIGTGVCIDTAKSNCKYCTNQYEAPNHEAYNEVYDMCTPEKAAALSTDAFDCVFSGDLYEALTCNDVTCIDYGTMEDQCNAVQPVTLNQATNQFISGSQDRCGVGICRFGAEDRGYCHKDGNGDGVPDCAINDNTCERDIYPPITTLIPQSNPPVEIKISIMDKEARNKSHQDITGQQDVLLHYCLEGCEDTSQYLTTNATSFYVQDFEFYAGAELITQGLGEENTLHYFAQDSHNNWEEVKTLQFEACEGCSPPAIMAVTVEAGSEHEGVWYSRLEQPRIFIRFIKEALLTIRQLIGPGGDIPVTHQPLDFAKQIEVQPQFALSEGSHLLRFDARNENNVSLPELYTQDIIIDRTPPTLTTIPEDRTRLDRSSVDVTLDFSENVRVKNVTLYSEHAGESATHKDYTRDFTGIKDLYEKRISVSTGRHTLSILAEDLATNTVLDTVTWFYSTGAIEIFLNEPSYGVSASTPFTFSVDTTAEAECRYTTALPEVPPGDLSGTYEGFGQLFDSSDRFTHTKEDMTAGSVVVLCKDEDGEVVGRKFELAVDDSAPEIISAVAEPDPVIEPVSISTPGIFSTRLVVELNKPGFCKYSTETDVMEDMEGYFAGWAMLPKKTLSATVQVAGEGEHVYNIRCKSKADIESEAEIIEFTVDTTVPFNVKTVTKKYWNITEIPIGVETNKKALCYLGDTEDQQAYLMNPGSPAWAHTLEVEMEPGEGAVYVRCYPVTGEETTPLEIPLIIDPTPPEMTFVNDTTTLEDTEIWYETDRLWVNYLGEDPETSVTKYKVKVVNTNTDETVQDWTESSELNGSKVSFGGLSLADGERYAFSVIAINPVGLESDEMTSDGVLINIEAQPESCTNGITDGEETDLDCGGSCAGCANGQACGENTDCESGYCAGGMCADPSCDDETKNGDETGIDCGGACGPCQLNATCLDDSDCTEGICLNGLCTLDSCADGVRTPGSQESDVDCGGACPIKCGLDQNCFTDADCKEGLECNEELQACIAPGGYIPGDEDGDGIRDADDLCPGTPGNEVPDDTGCSLSQKYSLGDEIDDKWRMDNFGCIDCDEAAADSDPDEDGLTNLEEYRYDSDPKDEDTDGDGWTDAEEIEAGTDPLDPADHPTSIWWWILWFLLIMLLLAGIAVGGYLLYLYYEEKKKPEPIEFKRPLPRPVKPAKPTKPTKPATPEKEEALPKGVEQRLKIIGGPGKGEALERLRGLAGVMRPIEKAAAKAGDIVEQLRGIATKQKELKKEKKEDQEKIQEEKSISKLRIISKGERIAGIGKEVKKVGAVTKLKNIPKKDSLAELKELAEKTEGEDSIAKLKKLSKGNKRKSKGGEIEKLKKLAHGKREETIEKVRKIAKKDKKDKK